jgi:hypothetical protein
MFVYFSKKLEKFCSIKRKTDENDKEFNNLLIILK